MTSVFQSFPFSNRLFNQAGTTLQLVSGDAARQLPHISSLACARPRYKGHLPFKYSPVNFSPRISNSWHPNSVRFCLIFQSNNRGILICKWTGLSPCRLYIHIDKMRFFCRVTTLTLHFREKSCIHWFLSMHKQKSQDLSCQNPVYGCRRFNY